MDDTPKLKEYEILSEDRRRGIDIFLKGVVIAAAFLGINFKFLLDSTTRPEILLSGSCGVVLLLFFHAVVWRCRRHVEQLHASLDEIAKELGLNPIISTRYIFNIVWIFTGIILFSWIAIFVYKMFP